MTDEEIVFAAVAQEQIADMIQSGIVKWPIDEPYGGMIKAAQVLFLRNQPVTLINLKAECNISAESWQPVRTVWQEGKKAERINWRPSAARIIEKVMARNGKSIAETLGRSISAGKISSRQNILDAITGLSSLLDNGSVYNATPSHHYHEGAIGEVVGSTGIHALDRILGGGLWSQALVGVGFPSSHGKSTLGYSILASTIKQGHRGVLFTFETQTSTAVGRILSAMTGVPLSDVIKRKGRNEENQRLIDQGLETLDKHLRIYDLSFNKPDRMEQVIRLERPMVGVIDHIDIVDPKAASRNANRNDFVGDIADAGLQWTIAYSFTLFLNSQFSNSKQAEIKRNHDLEQVDFFGSSRVFNALDFALIGLRHWSKPNEHYIRQKKNRKTGVMDVDAVLYHNPITQSFEDIP